MPSFFDPDNLTPEQQARYNWALAEYKRVQEINRALAGADAGADEGLLRALDRMNTPGPKSALFNRLLNGQAALPYPPPTSYSYPFYSLIEQGHASGLEVGGVTTLGGLLRGNGAVPGSERCIIINQCLWAVEYQNEAANALMELAQNLEPRQGAYLTEADSGRAAAVLRRRPEWKVRFGHWPAFTLYMGRATREGIRSVLHNPRLESDFSGGNREAGEVLRSGAQSRAERAARIATQRARPAGSLSRFEELTLLRDEAEALNDGRPAEDDDWIRFTCDAWCLRWASDTAQPRQAAG